MNNILKKVQVKAYTSYFILTLIYILHIFLYQYYLHCLNLHIYLKLFVLFYVTKA